MFDLFLVLIFMIFDMVTPKKYQKVAKSQMIPWSGEKNNKYHAKYRQKLWGYQARLGPGTDF